MINVTIQNIGTNTNASGAFNVTFYVEKESPGEGSYANGTKTRISGLSSGSSENITFSWIPASVGVYNITVFADSEHEVNESDETNNNVNRIVNVTWDTHNAFAATNETNNARIKPMSVNGTDLAVTSIEKPCNLSNPCYRGKEVNINATISNHGAIDATNFTVFFKEGIGGGNTSGFDFYNKTIQHLNSSENVSITATWKPLDFGWHTITVNVSFDGTDDNETNNEMFKDVPVKSEYDFSVEGVSVEPGVVKEGEHVNITAAIGNSGLVNGSVNVSFYVNVTDFVGSVDDRFIEIGRTEQPVYVEVGKTNDTSITWRANITGGDHLIFAVADPDDEFIEWPDDTNELGESIILKNQILAGNNVQNCTLRVIESDLNITLTLEPPQPVVGDLVNVIAEVKNEGSEKANSTVWFYMGKDIPEKVHKSGNKGGSYVISSLPQSENIENMSMRVHFEYIKIRNELGSERIGDIWVDKFWGMDDIFRAYVDDKSLDFYVKSRDVADGQPIRVSQIDYNAPCSECLNWSMKTGERICTKIQWNDVWTEWGYGKSLEVKMIAKRTFDVEVYVDKYQVRLGNRTVTLNAGECMPYNVTWNTSSLEPGENYTLVANVEDKVERNETFLGLTDLAVTDLSVEKEVLDGNQVWINASVENVGRKNATAFLINFTEIYVPTGGPSEYGVTVTDRYNNYKLVNSINVTTGLDAGNATNISVRWNASIRNITCEGKCQKDSGSYSCSWIETAEDYTINVTLIPLDENIEVEKGNNVKEEVVHVKRSRDFSVTNLSFIVNDNDNETRSPDSYGKVNMELGENVTLNATLNITNLANRGGMVNVSFYIDESDSRHEIGNLSTNFTVNETKSVEWNFGEVNIAGEHNIIVVVNPENRIHEINESNNEYIQQIHVRAPELTVTSLNFDLDPDKEMINESESINITVEVANYGGKNATNVSLVVYDCANRHIEDTDIRVYGSEVYPGLEKQEIERENTTAMKLYLDLDIEGGNIGINDSKGNRVLYDKNFHGWTPWIFDNNITIEAISNKNGSAFARVSKVYYLKPGKEINTTYNLTINKTPVNVSIKNWTASTVGERFIVATIDPENEIPEYNELNNTFAKYITVQTADLAVKVNLTWFDGTPIGKDEIIRDNDTVRIVANVTNIGVEEVENFDVRILVNDDELVNETKNILLNVSTNWTAKVGTHVIKVEADYDNEIVETNETNNIEAKEIYVYGAEVSGNTSWESLGLHGQILFDPSQPYDEDDVNITANITNSGYVNATNFSVALLFDYKPFNYTYHKMNDPELNWITKSYENAVGLYLYIDLISGHQVFAIYDGDDTEIRRTERSCGVLVPGDTAKIKECIPNRRSPEYNITFYPIYESDLKRIKRLDVNSSIDVSMNVTNVTAGNHTVMLFIDPEDKVPGDVDDKIDNIVTREMNALPTRDFTVTKVIPERTNIYDADVISVTANVSNVGYRNGTTRVNFVDYENESRIHRYYFDRGLNLSKYNLSYLPVSPDETLSSQYENLTIIRRPGVDAIQLNFSWIAFNPALCLGEIRVFNETGVDALSADPYDWLTTSNKNVLVQGDTAYIYTKCAVFNLSGYTGMKEFYYGENVTLNASVTWNETTKNITAMWNEPKNITAIWNASTGDHNITVIIDPDDEISEINEANNTYALPLIVNATKDPEIVDLNVSPLHPCDGDNVTITAVARNRGTERANFSVDLWMDTLKDSSSATVPNDWNITAEGKRRYITLLNHTELLSLAPGEEVNVTAIWENISVYGNPTYIVRAIVDPLDEIEEINESNNEMSPEIIMNYPDFNVTGFNSPTKEKNNASVIIENIGADDASNVTVRLELCRGEDVGYTPGRNLTITKEGASRIRVRFLELDTTGTGASIDIYGMGEDGKEYNKVKTYSEEKLQKVWSPWVNGDTIIIDYCGAAGFYIDECEWGDEYITEPIPLNASESVNVPLPERWNKYEGLTILYATVDPDNNEPEQREDNNNGTVMIYADLVPKGMEYVYGEEGGLKCVKACIMNNKTMKEEEGIAFPVYDFNVSLEVRPWNNDTFVYVESRRIDENQTIYGGEERKVSFDINESMLLAKNKTYNFTVVVDSEKKDHSWGEIDESIRDFEYNNEYSETVGPDISVGEIDIVPCPNDPPESCKFTINAVIKNEGDLSATNFSVMLKVVNSTNENDNETFNKTVPLLYPKDGYPENETTLEFPRNQGTSGPKVYDVWVIADPDDTVEELDEGNNKNWTKMYADISAESITKVPSAPIMNDTCYIGGIRNTGNLCTGNFEVRYYINSTDENFNYNENFTNRISLAPNEEYRFPWITPPQFNQSLGRSLDVEYDIRVVADPADEVTEWDESNNNGSNTVKVYTHTEYNGTNLDLYISGEVYGGVSYKLYDSPAGRGTNPTYPADFDLSDLPADARVVFARFYLYWNWAYNQSYGDPVPIDVNVMFNGNPPTSENKYIEYPHATTFDVAWGTYGYDILPGHVNVRGNNHVDIQKVYPHIGSPYYYTFAIFGAGLLVVYGSDEEGVLTNYWINEGADVLYDIKNNLEGTDLITTARFARDDGTDGYVNNIAYANATLRTVVPGGNDLTELYFNENKIGENVWSGNIGNDWRYVTEHLLENDNIAEFQYVGSGSGIPSMMSSNAFLFVGYPPDLVPWVKTPLSATAGKEYEIPVVINNIGLSNARGFTASVYVDEVHEKTVNITEIASGGSNTDLTFTRRAPLTEKVLSFNVTVEVDTRDNVTELINNQHPDGETNNNYTWPVTVVVESSVLDPDPLGGGGGGTGGGWGEGTGTGEGAGEGEGTGTGGAGGEGAVGETGGKAITGYLMKGSAVSGEEGGGGGKGEFSLVALLMRLMMLAAAVVLVCVGYLMERRRQNNKQ
ncbi:hypothetical protein ES705_03241 [subsurface metagenome]